MLESFSSRIQIFSEMGTEGGFDYWVTKNTPVTHWAVDSMYCGVTPTPLLSDRYNKVLSLCTMWGHKLAGINKNGDISGNEF